MCIHVCACVCKYLCDMYSMYILYMYTYIHTYNEKFTVRSYQCSSSLLHRERYWYDHHEGITALSYQFLSLYASLSFFVYIHRGQQYWYDHHKGITVVSFYVCISVALCIYTSGLLHKTITACQHLCAPWKKWTNAHARIMHTHMYTKPSAYQCMCVCVSCVELNFRIDMN